MRNPRRVLAATCLVLEAFVVFFAALVAKNQAGIGTGRALAAFGGLALACLLTAGLLRYRAGYALGSALQLAAIVSGFWVTTMFFLGGVFGALWIGALWLGARVERERAAYAAGQAS